jgi:hypothetical protein
LILGVNSVAAQAPEPTLTHALYGIGFVANAPEEMAGGSAYLILPVKGGIGLYVDAKFDVSNPSDHAAFVSDMTAADVRNQVPGNEFIKDESSWRSFDVAVIRPINPYLFAYLGGGMVRRTLYELYEEPSGTYGLNGVIWAEAVDLEETRANVMGGVFLRLGSHINTQFGFETEPVGVTAGVSARLPAW